jgi:hypothetical protein
MPLPWLMTPYYFMAVVNVSVRMSGISSQNHKARFAEGGWALQLTPTSNRHSP